MTDTRVPRMTAATSNRRFIPIPGGKLAITELGPATGKVSACVVINCAMSVKQSFYRPFAQFLASLGYSVTTWDYRGVGESMMDASTARQVSLDQWAREDLSLVIESVAAAKPGMPIVMIGHSFGGQIIALPENREGIRAALLIACPSGYVGHWRGKAKGRFMWTLAHLGLPVLTRLFGRFPASRLGLGADLPRQVALQWGRWLRHPRYVGGCLNWSERMTSFTAPIHAISMSDDDLAPSNAVDAMLSLYPNSLVTRELASPVDLGLKSIGHMGFFRARQSDSLWKMAAKRIEELLRDVQSNGGASGREEALFSPRTTVDNERVVVTEQRLTGRV